jgi:hypothetical protein
MNLANGEVYSIQSLNFVSDLRQVYGFLGGTLVSSTNENDRHDITKILLKVALNIFCFKSICPCDPPRGLHTYVLVTHPRGLYIYVHVTHPRGLYKYVHVTHTRDLYIYFGGWLDIFSRCKDTNIEMICMYINLSLLSSSQLVFF